jgi:hypothetical protein
MASSGAGFSPRCEPRTSRSKCGALLTLQDFRNLRRGLSSRPAACSGAMYAGVPSISPCTVQGPRFSWGSRSLRSCVPWSRRAPSPVRVPASDLGTHGGIFRKPLRPRSNLKNGGDNNLDRTSGSFQAQCPGWFESMLMATRAQNGCGKRPVAIYRRHWNSRRTAAARGCSTRSHRAANCERHPLRAIYFSAFSNKVTQFLSGG